MQPLFHPGLGFSLVHCVAGTAQSPQVLAAMPEIQKLSRVGPAVGLEIPNPWNPVPQHQLPLGAPQTSSQGFPMQPSSQVRRVALGAHYYFVGDQSPPPFGSARLLLQIKYAVLYFVPFYALLLGFVLSPARPTKARKPPVDHQQSQF